MCADDEENNLDAESLLNAPRLSNDDQCERNISLVDVQRVYIRFLIQLTKQNLLQKKVISFISSNIVVLIEGFHKLAHQRSIPYPHQITTTANTASNERVIEFTVLTNVVRDIANTIKTTARIISSLLFGY
jgi:hypothetical protein